MGINKGRTTITHGPVSLTLPANLALPEQSGKLTSAEVLHLPKAPRGIGLACDSAATAMEQAGAGFVAPAGIGPELLRRRGERAEGYDGALAALDAVRDALGQANLIADAEAWEAVRQVNDAVKGQVKYHPELEAMFAIVTAYMKTKK